MSRTDQTCCAPEQVPTTGVFHEDLGALCKALGHPARVLLIRILSEEGTCISGDLAESLDLAPSTVSEHLRILKEAGLVQGTIDGPRRCYCINRDALTYLRNLLQQLSRRQRSVRQ